MTVRLILRLLVLVAFAVTLCLSVSSHYSVRMREGVRTVMQIGLEDVAQRVRETSENSRLVDAFSRGAALSKARAFARIVAKDPEALAKPGELERIAADLDVRELHVSDERGILIHSLPASSRGYDMASSAQSAAFLPAITNADFAFVQEPMFTGIETNKLQQYAGVARRDRPGIVQVGVGVDRSEQAKKLADVGDIEKSARLGLDCTVRILPRTGLPPPADGVVRRRAPGGGTQNVVEMDCGDWRVRVARPVTLDWLADTDVYRGLLFADAVLFLLFVLTFPALYRGFRRDVEALRVMFGGRFSTAGAFRRAAGNPVTVACAVAFLLAVGLTWLLTANASRREARARLLAAAADMRQTVNDCADSLLFYQGQAIVRHYRDPHAMTVDTVQGLMDRYGLDELNVVDEKGIVLAGALADVGYDMGTNPLTARFNCLLAGAQTYSQDFRPPIEDPNGEKRKYAGVAFPWPVKGYVQMGFSEKRLRKGIDFWFEDAALKTHIGERGYFIIADSETGYIKSCGRRDPQTGAMTVRKGLTLGVIGFRTSSAPKSPDEFFTATLFGEECLCLSEVRGYHRIVCAIPLGEVSGGGRRTVLVSTAVLLAVFVLVVFFMTKLTNLVSSLQEKERVERERQLKDLTLAKTIQASSLPVAFPDKPDYKIFARMDTAREVGGDFYDFYSLTDDRTVFLVADVSGKGVPAALFMMRAKAQLRAAVAANPDDLAAAVVAANNALAEQNDAEMFVTAWIGVYDRRTGEVTYVNAGHNPPLVKRADGAVAWVKERSGLALAAMAGVPYRVRRIVLGPGDSLFLYTDGVTEGMNAAGELYGETRLERILSGSSELFITEVRADLDAFVAGAEPSDDVTMLALDVKSENDNKGKVKG